MQHGAPETRREPAGTTWIQFILVALPSATLLLIASAASGQVTERVSVDSLGIEANAGSTVSAVSADGRFVAFASGANNLVASDTNSVFDVFVHDRTTGTTERVSVGAGGAQANAMSISPSISSDGRFVAFVSGANNLVAGDTNGRLDVFVRDRMNGTTERVSLSSGGVQASADCFAPWLSGDGSRVVFVSSGSELVADDANATFDVFVRDRGSSTTLRVSVDSSGAEANGLSLAPRISADGLVVVFHSNASNLVPNDTNVVFDVYVHDLASGATERVSVTSDEAQANLPSVAGTLSADGRFVAFDSDATNLVANDTNFRTDVFVRDRVSGTTERSSVATGGVEANGQSGFVDPPSISANGRFVAFASGATNLVADDANNQVDIFVHDRTAGETTRASLANDGTEGDGATALWPHLSATGSVVVFASTATNLVADDTNFAQDIFVRANSCGDGVVDQGESCDDGNVEDGDCCSATCSFEPTGSACEDGDTCTSGDSCAEGVCVSGEADPDACLDPYQCRGAEVPWAKRTLRPGWLRLTDVLAERMVYVGAAKAVCSPVELASIDRPVAKEPLLACHGFHDDDEGECLSGAKIVVSNRHGTQTLSLGSSRRLCLAAGSEAVPSPETSEQYSCYAASPYVERRSSGKGRGGHHGGGSKKPQAIAFCTPAALDGGATVHPDAHLVCYAHSGWGSTKGSHGSSHGSSRGKTLHHVLGVETLKLLDTDRVCVPSRLRQAPAPAGGQSSLESAAHSNGKGSSGSRPRCSSRSRR